MNVTVLVGVAIEDTVHGDVVEVILLPDHFKNKLAVFVNGTYTYFDRTALMWQDFPGN